MTNAVQTASAQGRAAANAGAANAGYDLVTAERLELFGDTRRRAVDVVHEFRMRMQVLPPFGNFTLKVGDAVDDRHVRSRKIPPDRSKLRTGCETKARRY